MPIRFALPDGGIALTSDGTTWTVTGQYALPFTATATVPLEATPTYTLSLAAPQAAIQNGSRVQAAYQSFEHGFMVWRSDSGDVLAFDTSNRFWLVAQPAYQSLPDATEEPPNVALVRPINAFGKVWGNYPPIRDALGWAIQPEQCYFATFHDSSGHIRFSVPEHGVYDYSATSNFWYQTSMGGDPSQYPSVGC